MLALLPVNVVQMVSGIVFIVFGIVPWLRKEKPLFEDKPSSRLPLLASFSLIALMELGDKTQLITVTLAAENSALLVVVGLILTFALLTGVAVLVGAKLVARLPIKWLKLCTSVLFVILGCLSIVSAAFGLTIFWQKKAGSE